MPYIRVDTECLGAVKRLQGYYLLTEGKKISQGEALKRTLKEVRIDLFESNKNLKGKKSQKPTAERAEQG